jgi:hypothetical protein
MITAGSKVCPACDLVDRLETYLYLFDCKELPSYLTPNPEKTYRGWD